MQWASASQTANFRGCQSGAADKVVGVDARQMLMEGWIVADGVVSPFSKVFHPPLRTGAFEHESFRKSEPDFPVFN